MTRLVKLVRQPDWLLGREIELPEVGFCNIVAVNPEKNEVTVAQHYNRRFKVSIDFCEDFYLREVMTEFFEPKQKH